MKTYFDVGSFHRIISTNSKDAQLWFDRGLTWCYGFNHKEGLVCFEKAIEADERCAMAYWGVAYASGPNYNKAWKAFDPKDLKASIERADNALETAKSLSKEATPVETALINALRDRFPAGQPSKDMSAWSTSYANAMTSVYSTYGDDIDVAVLHGEALICLTPWALWDIKTGKPAPGSRVSEAKDVFDKAFTHPDAYTHPGLLHLYIHLIEMSATPEKGLLAADHLRGLCPDVGHLEHMPTHIDVLVGDYRRSIDSNASAVRADRKFSARHGILNFYTMYRSHSLQSLIYAAMFAGQSEVALQNCTELESILTEELLRLDSPPMGDWCEGYNTIRMHVLVRFGRWHDILKLKLPKDQDLWCVTTAMTHYAKAVASAALGNIDDAERERSLFKPAFARVPPSRLDFPNKYVDILAVAEAMLDAELQYRKRNFDEAWKLFRAAMALDDSLVYSEPWGWMVPTRHAFGALLLEQGHVEEAARLYAADLGFDTSLPPGHRHPNNVFALHGYHECLVRLGRDAEARLLEQQLRIVSAVADISITSSCFCRMGD